jgi:hypothetical protein
MAKRHLFISITVLFMASLSAQPSRASTPTLEELWALVQAQQAEINALKTQVETQQLELSERAAEVAEVKTENEAQSMQLEATLDYLETSPLAQAAPAVSIGGYGELHYNNLDSGNEIDYHRFVLYFGHAFTENLSFYSELELEHALAGEGAPGEIELEQAFVQWDFSPSHRIRAGMMLVPVGFLNETHEPDTFYGVERNSIEKNVIPTTWWEAGASLSGEVTSTLKYDFMLHSGLALDLDHPSAKKQTNIRSARQKVSEATAEALAYSGRLEWQPNASLKIGGTVQYQADLTQGAGAGGAKDIDGLLIESHLEAFAGPFSLRALYARWDLDDAIAVINAGSEKQLGWYVEPRYRISDRLGLFARYGEFDLQAGQNAMDSQNETIDVGLNYWIHETVVIKADIQRYRFAGETNRGFNIGVGYSF